MVEELPHTPESLRVEDWQMQLWMGMRAVAALTRQRLDLPTAEIERTLSLWRMNWAEATKSEAKAEEWIHREMISWLSDCVERRRGLLPAPLLTVWRFHNKSHGTRQ